jgi:hypothetical protein
MTQITTQSIVDTLNSIEVMKSKLNLELMNKNMELRDAPLYQEIKDLEMSIKELSTQETQIKEQGKNLLLNAGLKKFEALNGTVIQLNATPPAVKIINENLIPNEYKKTITTITIDKKLIKEEIKL